MSLLLLLRSRIHEGVSGKLLLHESESDELSQQVHRTVAWQMPEAGKAVQCEGFGLLGQQA